MDFVKNIVCPCVGQILGILGILVDPVITHGNYVRLYKNLVQELQQEKKRLGEKKERIQGMVEIEETNYGKVIVTEVSSWLEEVNQMERDIANFLRQQENEEQMERDIANLRQQENGEQMERDFSNFPRQQQNGESFRCFPGCMCPNLMWRHKRGKEAHERKEVVSKLISRGENLERLPVARDAPFRSDLHFVSPQYYTKFQSRDSIVDEINNALKDSGVHVIGIHGPGGAGKTTMVIEVAKEATKQGIFDKFVVAVVSKDLKISKIQEELASQLDFNYNKIGDIGRADELRKALSNRKKKILVILDDLWEVLVLNAIGIPTSGCKILLTSRNEEVLGRMKVHLCVPIGYLEEQEALKLFTNVTGDFGVDGIAREVCKRCGGLPIAIVAVGAALEGKDDCEWRDALNQLENGRVNYIEGKVLEGYTPLKWSYDFLKEEDAKSCFLLCCLFPEDAEIPIDDLVRYSFALGFLRKVATLKDARNRVQTMVNTLKRSCLLLNGKNKNFVKMHDVIRDLAISITNEKQIEQEGPHDWTGQQRFIVEHNIKEWPKNDAWEHYTAISLRINNDKIGFPCGVFHCPLMHTLVLESGKSSPRIPNDFFEGMKEARVLDFKNIVFRLPSYVLELDHLRMLRLSLNICQLQGDWSTIQNLNHIKILSFEGSRIVELPQDIGKLTHLRSLDLRWCSILNMIPEGVISNLIHLEELYVTHRFKKWDTTIHGGGMSNASIAELKSLNQLTVLHIGISTNSYRIMVQECRYLFQNLINFSIFINNDYSSSDDVSLNALEIYHVQDIEDEFCLLMDKVEELRLWEIKDLRYLRGKPQLHFTPCGEGSFSKLIDLDIFRCHNMEYLFSPSCAKALQRLKTLQVCDCSIMERIIGVGDHLNEEEVVDNEAIIFSRLEMINLSILPQFRSFGPKMEMTPIEENSSNQTTTAESIFNEKVSFPILEKLVINMLSAEDIWNKKTIQSPNKSNKVSFSQVKHIEVTQCPKLVNVFPSNMLLRLQNLETLFVEDCSSLTLLAENLKPNIQSHTIKVFPKLRDLVLDSLPKLMKIWPNDEDYCSNDNYIHLYLKAISISYCDNLRHAFPAFVARHLAYIEDLCVHACPKIEVIVSETSREGVIDDGIIEFCQLKILRLEDLPNLKNFSQSKSEPSHLFNQVSFPVLKKLKIDKLSVEDIWNKQTIQSPKGSNKVSFSQLKHIEVYQCHKLVNVFPSNMLPRLQNLEKLVVDDCVSLTFLVEDLNPNIQSPSGMEVMVSEAGGEGVIDDGIIKFCQLKTLKLQNLPNLKSFSQSKSEASHFFNDQVTFPKIKYIFLINLDNSREIQLWDLLATTQEHLCTVKIFGCQLSTKVSSHHQKRSSIMIVDELFLKNCQGFKYVIDLNGTISIGEEQFVDVKSLMLHDLPELVLLWNKNLHEIGSLRNLKDIFIKNCSQLKSLFTHSMATTFHHLEKLSVTSCEMMEEIIIIEENNINFAREEKTTLHIEFSKLRSLFLDDLPNLKKFCNDDERGSFSFSSLHIIEVRHCPKMKTFASGQICLSQGMIQAWVGKEVIEITDLNAYFESRNEDNNHIIEIVIWGSLTFFETEYDSDVDISREDD